MWRGGGGPGLGAPSVLTADRYITSSLTPELLCQGCWQAHQCSYWWLTVANVAIFNQCSLIVAFFKRKTWRARSPHLAISNKS